MIPCAYLRYYYMSDDILKQELGEASGEGTRGEVVKAIEQQLFDLYRNPDLAEKPKALEGRGGQYYSEAACELMSAIHNDKRIIMHVNTRNNGAINGLPDECAVEVSALITKSGPLPLNVAPFPQDTLRLLQLMKEFEQLTIEAAITGNRHTAWRALVLNPLITSGSRLEQALDEVIAAHPDLMSAFH
jgi:6-phospho-beta-glucosidase